MKTGSRKIRRIKKLGVLIATLLLTILVLSGCKKGNEFYTDYDEVAYNVFGEGYGALTYGSFQKHVDVIMEEGKVTLEDTEDLTAEVNQKVLEFIREIDGMGYETASFTVKIEYEDSFGNNYKDTGYKIEFTQETVDNKDLETVNGEDLPDIVDSYEIHQGIENYLDSLDEDE